ncbi:MAG TPA: PilW family protein [Gammaproteobacteria bacterium]
MKPLISQYHQKGFSLVELMVAMTIGLLITLAVIALFITTGRNYSQNDNTAKMQENARFALELISQDLRHAGFLGNVADISSVNVDAVPVTTPAVDCGPTTASGRAGLYNFSLAKLVLSYGYQISNASMYGSCITGPAPKSLGNILLIKRTAGDPSTTQVGGTLYIYANGSNANLLTQPNAPVISNGAYWEYQPRLYYIDQNDVLYREILDYSGATPTMRAESLAEGIEAFHVEFGIDTDYNGTPDYYYVPAANADPFTIPGDTALNDAVSATLYILARTTTPDPDPTYLDQKRYTLGSMPTLGPFPDQFHRHVYSITVALKNLRPQVKNRGSIN